MRVLQVHNYYKEPGGEDNVVLAEAAMLKAHGVEVHQHTVTNAAVDALPKMSLARKTVWNAEVFHRIVQLQQKTRADIVHVHNTLPLLSPSVYSAAGSHDAGVVQTLHNYRFVCPSGLLFRDGEPCETCVGRLLAWPAVVHACYRGDRSATSVVSAMLAYHRIRGTYRNWVDRYITLTEFGKTKFVEAGLPAGRLTVKPNFVNRDPGVGDGNGGYGLFVGRLSQEKGVRVLLDAWRRVGSRLSLRIVGDGPLGSEVASVTAKMEGVHALGRLAPDQVVREMMGAMFLVVPSLWYEGFPMVVAEAYAVGTPVVASGLGALREIVRDGAIGCHVPPGDPVELAKVVLSLLERPKHVKVMRGAARREYESKYTEEVNYRKLMAVYTEAIASAGRRARRRS